jgi:hypothetical protein
MSEYEPSGMWCSRVSGQIADVAKEPWSKSAAPYARGAVSQKKTSPLLQYLHFPQPSWT